MTPMPRAGARGEIALGGLAPLSTPGLVAAGRDLRDGMMLATADVNENRRADHRRLSLAVRDSGAGATAAVEAVEKLVADGIIALVGEFHSAVAVPVSSVATRLAVPFLCSSATADAVVDDNPVWVFRLACRQSRGWTLYADYLTDNGAEHVAIVADDGDYWRHGVRYLHEQLTYRGVDVSVVRSSHRTDELDRIRSAGEGRSVDAVILLLAYPEPFTQLLRALRGCANLRVAVGDPAGRVAFRDCVEALGSDAAGISHLAYMPRRTHRTRRGGRQALPHRVRPAAELRCTRRLQLDHRGGRRPPSRRRP